MSLLGLPWCPVTNSLALALLVRKEWVEGIILTSLALHSGHSSDRGTMEVQTENEVYENPLLEPLPEAPEGQPVRSSSRGGSPISPSRNLHRLFSFKSGFERLDLHPPSDLRSERAPFSANEAQKSIVSPMEQQWTNPPPERPIWTTIFYGWWTVELLAFVVSLASLIAMIVLLRHYNGRSQLDWPHNITLNSVLSWCTTLFKASLLVPVAACFGQSSWAHYRSGSRPLTDLAIYESASRGPMGSIQLLWYFKAKCVPLVRWQNPENGINCFLGTWRASVLSLPFSP